MGDRSAEIIGAEDRVGLVGANDSMEVVKDIAQIFAFAFVDGKSAFVGFASDSAAALTFFRTGAGKKEKHQNSD